MNKLSAGILLTSLFFASCNKKDIQTLPKSTKSLSALSANPDFAKPITSTNENRVFSIGLKDGKQLNFSLNTTAQTMFDKKRSLVGTVSINNKVDKVVMLIADNGFAINYLENGHMLTLKSKVDLDFGYKAPAVNINSAEFKAGFDAYAKKIGYFKAIKQVKIYTDGLASVKNTQISKNYDVVVEQNDRFIIVDKTLTDERKQLAEGTINNEHDMVTINATEKMALPLTTENSLKNIPAPVNYNLEIAYQEPGFDLNTSFAYLAFSFIYLDPTATHIWWIPTVSSIFKDKTQIEVLQIQNAATPVRNSEDQLNNLYTLNHQFMIKQGFCRIALYHRIWDNGYAGRAFTSGYSTPFFYRVESCLIASDYLPSALAHECGHNLGAIHVNNPNDIMYYASHSIYHLDALNIKTIFTSLGF